LEALQQQEQELKQTLNKSAEVEAGLAQLLQPVPILLIWISCNPGSSMLQHRASLQTQMERVQARMVARLEELQSSEDH